MTIAQQRERVQEIVVDALGENGSFQCGAVTKLATGQYLASGEINIDRLNWDVRETLQASELNPSSMYFDRDESGNLVLCLVFGGAAGRWTRWLWRSVSVGMLALAWSLQPAWFEFA